MRRSAVVPVLPILPILLTLTLGCDGQKPLDGPPPGGAGTSGAPGSTGSAGTAAAAGTSGGAGTAAAAGTTGAAGTTAAAGTSGGAGTSGVIGTTGVAGAGGELDISRLSFNDVWGSGPSDVWAVGGVLANPNPTQPPAVQVGTILHWDGKSWTRAATTDATQFLNTVWGSGPNDVWAMGGQAILHWDGKAWSLAEKLKTLTDLLGLWGSGPNDVWAVSYEVVAGVAIRHWDGKAWTVAFGDPTATSAVEAEGAMYGVWGSAPNDVWAVGENGVMAHWNGLNWALTPSGTTSTLRSIWGSGAADVWAVGGRYQQGTIRRWDGKAWSDVTSPPKQQLLSVWGGDFAELWIGGVEGIFRGDRSSWTATVQGFAATAIWGSSPRDVWFAGTGTLLHMITP
jgi:hypothetical protein